MLFPCIGLIIPKKITQERKHFQSIYRLMTSLSYTLSYTDSLGAMLSAHVDKPRVYLGCMKSGEVFSDS